MTNQSQSEIQMRRLEFRSWGVHSYSLHVCSVILVRNFGQSFSPVWGRRYRWLKSRLKCLTKMTLYRIKELVLNPQLPNFAPTYGQRWRSEWLKEQEDSHRQEFPLLGYQQTSWGAGLLPWISLSSRSSHTRLKATLVLSLCLADPIQRLWPWSELHPQGLPEHPY